MSRQWHRQPLVQFLGLGAVIFGVHFLLRSFGLPASGPLNRTIHITAPDLARIQRQFQRLHGRLPTQAELDGLVEGSVREEVLVREAMALGLDQDDSIVRRRLVQKMEFLALEVTAEPTDAQLQAWFDQNRERYRRPERISFTHIYFSKDRRGEQAGEQAREALSILVAKDEPPMRAPELGDPFLNGYDFVDRSSADVERAFGRSFSERVLRVPAGGWVGPIQSSYGQHLVRVLELTGSRLADFAEVKAEVIRDATAEWRNNSKQAAYENLRSKYRLVIDEPSLQSRVEQGTASP